MALIIVESPTKARTFNRILKGKKYYVFATLGHIRDLPSDKMSVNYDENFKPDYKIIKGREKVVTQLKKLASENDEIILASDLDREGESISYHTAYLLGFIKENWPDFKIDGKKKKLMRIVFHEITPNALKEALEKPQELRPALVKAQQARRILDRIVGYELSPLLWKKLGKNWLSAGRVQTVALRLVVEREKEIQNFKQEDYFQVYGNFKDTQEFRAKLIKKDGEPYERSFTIQLFDGEYKYTKTIISKDNLGAITDDLKKDSYKISEIVEEVKEKYPPPPLTTSLLQQEAFSNFGFPAKLAMRLAQDLYERGYITYHRTDSFALSTQFVFAAKRYIEGKYGEKYTLEKPRGYKTRSRMAQEAHEAIRPTHLDKSDEIMAGKLTPNHKKIYDLILRRAVSTQMKEAQVKLTKAYVEGEKKYLFESEFQQVLFDGFLKVLNPGFSERHTEAVSLTKGEKVELQELESKDSKTQPPYRYNEASLIKTLEARGIGRPSTYAPIISLIQEKMYINREGRYFLPTALGSGISDYLSGAFPQLFDINFTASMEEQLDEVAQGNQDVVKLLSDFFDPFSKELEKRKTDTTTIEIKEDPGEPCTKCGKPMIMRYSKFGKFLACSGYPACKTTKALLKTVPGKKCPTDGGQIVVRYTKRGKRFFGCENYPKCKFAAFVMKDLN